MNKKLILFLVAFMLVGCGKTSSDFENKEEPDPVNPNPENEDDSLEHVELLYEHPNGNESAYLDELMEGYATKVGNKFYPNSNNVYSSKIEAPSKFLTYDSLIDLFDYCAFYKITEYIIHDAQTSILGEDIDNYEKVLNNVFWDSNLCVGTVGYNSSLSLDKKTIKLNFYFNEFADLYKTSDSFINTLPTTIPYTYFPNSTSKKRSESNTSFPYQTKQTGKTIDIFNSDQLIYALQKGYKINIIDDSPAENIYKVATNILNGIIDDSMTSKDKAMAISAWLISHNVYDWTGCSNAAFVRKDGDYQYFPDCMASMYTSFYAEGTLIYGTSVCQAMSKGFALLALLEGLDVNRVSAAPGGVNKDSSISSILPSVGYDSHGYCYIKENNQYYFADINFTFVGQSTFTFSDGVSKNFMSNRNIGLYLSKESWDCAYGSFQEDYFYQCHEEEVADVSLNISSLMKINKDVSFAFSNSSEANSFISGLKNYLDNYNDSNYLSSKNNGYYVFQFPVSIEWMNPISNGESVDIAIDYIDQIVNVVDSRGDYSVYGYFFEEEDIKENLDLLNWYIEITNANSFVYFFNVK